MQVEVVFILIVQFDLLAKRLRRLMNFGAAQKRHFFLCLCLVLFHWKADNLILGDVCAVASPREQRVLAQLA